MIAYVNNFWNKLTLEQTGDVAFFKRPGGVIRVYVITFTTSHKRLTDEEIFRVEIILY